MRTASHPEGRTPMLLSGWWICTPRGQKTYELVASPEAKAAGFAGVLGLAIKRDKLAIIIALPAEQ